MAMNKKSLKLWLVCLGLLLGSLVAFGQELAVDPKFNGGDVNDFAYWVAAELVYPEEAANNGIQGRVMVTFTVSKTGKVQNVRVLRRVEDELDAEAIRVVSSSPEWTPGYDTDGNPVAVTYSIPVVFKL